MYIYYTQTFLSVLFPYVCIYIHIFLKETKDFLFSRISHKKMGHLYFFSGQNIPSVHLPLALAFLQALAQLQP